MVTVKDGKIKPAVFDMQAIKLLWILKESNIGKTKKTTWDLCKFLRNRKKELFQYDKWQATWGLVCKISWGILEPTESFSKINTYNYDPLAQILDRIAVINVKKVAGGSSVDYNRFNDYINKNDGEYLIELHEKIKMIAPDIVVCGNTFQYVYPKLNFNYNKNWCWRDNKNGIKWINGWHPNQKKISHETYFNEVRKVIA